MATRADELDLPAIDLLDVPFEDAQAMMRDLAGEHWLVKNPFGYTVMRYDDVTAVLRDKRWHNAASILPQMAGVTNEEFLARQRISILSAEGEVHTRLRRLVAP